MSEEVFDRAVRAYRRMCARDGGIFQQPCSVSSECDERSIVLRNANGDLAAFDILDNGKLRYRQPVES